MAAFKKHNFKNATFLSALLKKSYIGVISGKLIDHTHFPVLLEKAKYMKGIV